jgi:hypothetical protein
MLVARCLPFIAFSLLLTLGLSARAAEDQLVWPGVDYTSVKAYLFDGETALSIIVDGNLNPSVEKVARLSIKQVPRITAALRDPPKLSAAAMCFEPRHAFVYFDEFSRPVAWLNICYHCKNYTVYPPLPKKKILDLPALLPLFRDLELPVPGDRAFETYVKRSGAHHPEQFPKWMAFLSYLPKPPEDALPPTVAAWPWRKAAKVKLYEFNLAGRDEAIVHLGQMVASITKEVELNDEQRRAVWVALQRPDWEPLDATREIRMEGEGRALVRTKGAVELAITQVRPSPLSFRHGLVCFDDTAKPIAWVNVSFAEGQYTSSPTDGPLNFSRSLWNLHKLRATFLAAGIPIRSPEEYDRLREEARK